MSINKASKYLLLVLLCWVGSFAWGQELEGVSYQIKETDLYCRIDRSIEINSVDSILGTCGINTQELQALLESGEASPDRWQVYALSAEEIVLKKSLHSLKGKASNQKELMEMLNPSETKYGESHHFGYNLFRKPAITVLANGKSRFFLKVKGKPRSVLISGTFNDWSTSSHPMVPCDSGYYIDLALADGVHYYKYIVNGYWILDPRNRLTESDWSGNENSVYFKTNHRFTLEGYQDAEEVLLAGSFNGWNEADYSLEQKNGLWQRDCYVREGTHAYKYIVDDEWIVDPGNKVIREDAMGHENSFMAVGDTFYFFYPRHPEAEEVVVSGNFNVWDHDELRMQRSDSGWVLPYVLPAGNYEYKFRVAGEVEWQLDPLNPITTGSDERKNSVLCLKPNKHFFFPHQSGVEEVIVTGDFNAWQEWGYKMELRADGWHADIHLPKGKTRYKFIIDGEWIRDPSNPLFEPNEYDGFNSIVWVK